jgi:hypothetical protein
VDIRAPANCTVTRPAAANKYGRKVVISQQAKTIQASRYDSSKSNGILETTKMVRQAIEPRQIPLYLPLTRAAMQQVTSFVFEGGHKRKIGSGNRG